MVEWNYIIILFQLYIYLKGIVGFTINYARSYVYIALFQLCLCLFSKHITYVFCN